MNLDSITAARAPAVQFVHARLTHSARRAGARARESLKQITRLHRAREQMLDNRPPPPNFADRSIGENSSSRFESSRP